MFFSFCDFFLNGFSQAQKCGHSTHTLGLSHERFLFPVRLIGNGMSISKITNTGYRVSTKDLHHIYDGRISNSTLVKDKMNSYVRFTNVIGIELLGYSIGKLKLARQQKASVQKRYKKKYLLKLCIGNIKNVLGTLKTDRCRDLSIDQ